MKKSILAIAMLTTFLMSACMSETTVRNSGKTVTKNVETSNFERIKVYGSMDVYYTQDAQTSVKVKASEETMKRLEVKTESNTLVIRTKSDGFKFFSGSFGPVEVYVTSPDIIGVSILGSGDFVAEKPIDTDNMEIDISGSGDVEMKSLICDGLSVSIAGSGDVDLKQLTVGKVDFSVAGSGDISVGNAKIDYAESSIAGSGCVTIKGHVNKHSESIAGSGDVSINGAD